MATLSTSTVELITDRIVKLDSKIDGVEQRLAARLDKVDSRLGAIENKLDLVVGLMQRWGAIES